MRMKKYNYLLILLIFSLISSLLIAQEAEEPEIKQLIIKGDNQLKYIYRAAEDSLKNYFTNELKFSLNYDKFTFGMTFIADLPKYDQYSAIDELNPSQVSYKWDERYVILKQDPYYFQAGTFEEAFGAGLVLRAWNDSDNDRDKRLDGALVRYNPENLMVKFVYGALRNTISDQQIFENDIVTGVDAEYKLMQGLKLGASALQYKQQNAISSYQDYTHRNIYALRSSFINTLTDINAEFAEIRYEHNTQMDKNGYAFYVTNNIFIDQFTITSGYKKYHRYYYTLSDLPNLNHYDQLLSSIGSLETEEGLMGEVRYIPNLSHEMAVHYSEAWNQNFKIRFANLFAEYKYNTDNYSIQTEFEQIETKDDPANSWEKEIHPTITFDFYSLSMPLTIKTKWGVKDLKHGGDEINKHEPYLQFDVKLNEATSISVIGEYEFEEWEDFGKKSMWIGSELKTSLSHNTELKLFAGKEKGGKVCRNGVCKYQSPFEGLRVELSTSF